MGEIRVRATINLPKLQCGQVAYVDPADPYVQACLERGNLVPDMDEPEPTVTPA